MTAFVFCAAAKTADGWELGALRIGDGHFPLYRRFCFAGPDGESAPALAALRAFCRDAFVLAHGEAEWHDWQASLAAPGPVWADTRELALLVFPTAGKYGLADLAAALLSPSPRRAAGGAWARCRHTLEIFGKISDKALSFDLGLLQSAAALLGTGTAAGELCAFAAREARRLAPDRPIHTEMPFMADEGLFAAQKRTPVAFPPEWTEACFAPNGLLARQMSGFEDREEQRVMARAVTQGLARRENLVVEAGTGTGKSAAYLLPAIWWARGHECRVVVATHTITLQEQLCRKDLPFLAEALPFSFRFLLLKGRGNYCCRQRLSQREPSPDAPREERLAWLCLRVWVRETRSGDLSELPQAEIGAAWKKYSCENPFCDPLHCRENKFCYMLLARRAAENADIIIVNHSLLLSDLKTGYSILPEHEDIIIDEAHNFYSEAVQQLGFALSPETLRRLLELIHGPNRHSVAGYYRRHANDLLALVPEIDWIAFAERASLLPDLCRETEQAGEGLFRLAGALLEHNNALRVLPEKMGTAAFDAFTVETENLINALSRLTAVLTQMEKLLFLDNQQLSELRRLLARHRSEAQGAADGLAGI
ncbi:MAG: ATP-dependent DNA helicase, partial [Gracilibacteraceae bacterium]|nr:ATP-dependent DNA helicase [Gracilibacteraceae bacterium]